MIRAVALHCLCEPLAQFRTKAAEFDSLAGVFKWYRTNFHRFVCSFVPVLLKTINSWALSRSVLANLRRGSFGVEAFGFVPPSLQELEE